MSAKETPAAAAPNLVYCRCAYARVVPRKVKDGVLEGLADAGVDFDAVPDLCEMSARKDPRLAEIAGGRAMTIAACYPRAVRWLFSSAGAPLDRERVTILNMREETAEAVTEAMLTRGGAGAGAVGADSPDAPAADDAGRPPDGGAPAADDAGRAPNGDAPAGEGGGR